MVLTTVNKVYQTVIYWLQLIIDILEDKLNFDQDNTEKPVENPRFQISAHDDINKVIDEGTPSNTKRNTS